jgi:hypothetical protein
MFVFSVSISRHRVAKLHLGVSFFHYRRGISCKKTKRKFLNFGNLYNKRVRPTKNEPQQGISYLEREREGVRERGVSG